MKKNLLFFLRAAAFLACVLLLITFGNRFLIQQDTIAYLTMKELHERSDFETVVIGSSVAQLHFDPEIIEQHTGRETMCATITNLGLPGMLALTREVFETNSPETIVLVVEGYTFQALKEDMQTQFKLMPHLTRLQNKREYYHNLTEHDHTSLERMLMLNSFGWASVKDIQKAFALARDPMAYFSTLPDEFGNLMTYTSGYVPASPDQDLVSVIREEMGGVSDEHAYWLHDFVKDMLADIHSVCEENGAQLMVVAYPALSLHAVAEPFYLEYLDLAGAYCAEIGVPYYNFTYAKPEFMPCLDEYFFDLHHFSQGGAEIFSDAFGRFLTALDGGEDVSGWFYPRRYEYIDSLGEKRGEWLSLLESISAQNSPSM